jgi:hypothetical protein
LPPSIANNLQTELALGKFETAKDRTLVNHPFSRGVECFSGREEFEPLSVLSPKSAFAFRAAA